MPRNSSFAYKGRSPDLRQVGHELGVRYVLEGSVRKAGSRVRITAQLIETTEGSHLWADRFDGSLDEVFERQDMVAMSVAGVIEPTLQAAEIRRSFDRPTADPTAYDRYLRALAPIRSAEREKERYVQGLETLRRAIACDPGYGRALALAGHCHLALDAAGWTNDVAANQREGVELARRALTAAGDDPGVLAVAAYVLAYFGEDIAAALFCNQNSF